MPALTYDSRNGEARFVASWFAAQPNATIKVSWRVRGGDSVSPGDTIADLTWDNGDVEDLVAPRGCSGIIEATNRRIRFATLDRRPAQWALRLVI